MADLNALIAQGYQPPAPFDPFAQHAKMQQLEQGMQANQLNAMKMQEMQAATTERNALRQLDPSSPDYENQLFKVNPTIGIAYRKEAATIAAQKAAMEKENAQSAAARKTMLSQAYRDISSRPSDANITAHMEDVLDSPLFKPEEKIAVQKHAQTLLGMPFEQRGSFLAGQGATASDLSTAATAKAGQEVTMRGQDIGAATAKAGQDVTMRGQDIGATTAKAGQDVTARGQDIGAATAKAGQAITLRGQNLTDTREKQRIVIAQEDQRRAADPAFQQQMAGAKQLGQAMATNQVLRETQLPKVLDTATQTLAEVDALIGKRDANGVLLKGQKPHPGFGQAVGAGLPLRFIPGTAESDFQTRFDQIKGGAFLQAFETLKGGGSITNVEGEKGTAALNRMNLAQSEAEFVQAAREFQSIIRTGMDRAKKMAGKPSVAAAPNVDALLEKYK